MGNAPGGSFSTVIACVYAKGMGSGDSLEDWPYVMSASSLDMRSINRFWHDAWTGFRSGEQEAMT